MRESVERLFDGGQWARARWILEGELLATPDDHWVHTQLALSWYEDHRLDEALGVIEKALTLAPECPAARWYHGGILHALKRLDEANAVFGCIVERGLDWAMGGECGLGIGLAKGLLADTWWRLWDLHTERGDHERASEAHERHLTLLGRGCFGLYTLDTHFKYEPEFLRRQLRMRNSIRRPVRSPALN